MTRFSIASFQRLVASNLVHFHYSSSFPSSAWGAGNELGQGLGGAELLHCRLLLAYVVPLHSPLCLSVINICRTVVPQLKVILCVVLALLLFLLLLLLSPLSNIGCNTVVCTRWTRPAV